MLPNVLPVEGTRGTIISALGGAKLRGSSRGCKGTVVALCKGVVPVVAEARGLVTKPIRGAVRLRVAFCAASQTNLAVWLPSHSSIFFSKGVEPPNEDGFIAIKTPALGARSALSGGLLRGVRDARPFTGALGASGGRFC